MLLSLIARGLIRALGVTNLNGSVYEVTHPKTKEILILLRSVLRYNSTEVSLMKKFLKRIGICLLLAVLFQVTCYLIGRILDAPIIALIGILPGWAFIFAGRSSGPAWGLPIMLIVNAIIYAPFIYLLLWWRPFKKKEVISLHIE
jgi:hypothetical protein